uniref:Uncharacterized protein LOC111103152 n=1 Tax=Crassostrea virginica TaxID=6565 RepID=A0A8B8AP43_CRAVI|nr:uncharacterized protein LOC111103152 [Crassostrea virginica]
MLIDGSLTILGGECRNLCKRNSGSVLQDKSSTNALEFTWDSLYAELQIRAPNVLKTVSAMVTDIPIHVNEKPFQHIMYSVSQILHGRSQEMSLVQYLSGFVLLHGGCTLKDIERIAKLGASVHPVTLRRKLDSWDAVLDAELLKYKEE